MSTPVGHKREWFAAIPMSATPTTVKAAHSATSTIYVTRMIFVFSVHADAEYCRFEGTDNIVYGNYVDQLDANGGWPVVPIELGKYGSPITVGEDLTFFTEDGNSEGFAYAEGWEDIGDGAI